MGLNSLAALKSFKFGNCCHNNFITLATEACAIPIYLQTHLHGVMVHNAIYTNAPPLWSVEYGSHHLKRCPKTIPQNLVCILNSSSLSTKNFLDKDCITISMASPILARSNSSSRKSYIMYLAPQVHVQEGE